jgi:hypothetical protein
MKELKEQIEIELSKSGISTKGSLSEMPKIIFDAINTVKEFGFEYWLKRTTTGSTVKQIVLKLSK